jgi:hypothetical protein
LPLPAICVHFARSNAPPTIFQVPETSVVWG